MVRIAIVLALFVSAGIPSKFTPSRAFGADGPSSKAVTNGGVKDGMTLETLLSTRDQLHSGVCRASWRWTTTSHQEDATWAIWFDYDKGLSRIDRDVPTRSRRVKRIDTPVEMVLYVEGVNVICRNPPHDNAPLHAEPFDLRTVGLVELTSLRYKYGTWQGWVDYARRQGVPQVFADADGRQRLVWGWDAREVTENETPFYDSRRWTVWVDPATQFSPVRSEIWHGTSETKEIRQELIEVIEAEWAEKDGTMVPTRCHWRMPKHGQEAELTFEWESVNAPVSETLFTPEAMGAPQGTYIVNRRLGEDVIESIIGGQPPLIASKRPTWRHWAVVINGAVLAVIAVWLIRRRRGLRGA